MKPKWLRNLPRTFYFQGLELISCSDFPLRWVQSIAFRKKGKVNSDHRQYRWERKSKPEASGPAVASWGPTRHYKSGKDNPKTSSMSTAALWICTGSAPCPLSPFLPNSTFVLRSPKTWDCHHSLWIEKFSCKLFLGIWCVSYTQHIMWVPHTQNLMACCEAQRWEGYMCLQAGSSICWDCFCLRPPLRAGTALGAVRRFSAHLDGVMNCVCRQRGGSKV